MLHVSHVKHKQILARFIMLNLVVSMSRIWLTMLYILINPFRQGIRGFAIIPRKVHSAGDTRCWQSRGDLRPDPGSKGAPWPASWAESCSGRGRVTHICVTWWRHQMETFSALLALCAGNSPVTGEFPSQRPAMWSFEDKTVPWPSYTCTYHAIT